MQPAARSPSHRIPAYQPRDGAVIAGLAFSSCGPVIVKTVWIADPHGYREERYSSSRNAPSSESACAGGEVRGESRAPRRAGMGQAGWPRRAQASHRIPDYQP